MRITIGFLAVIIATTLAIGSSIASASVVLVNAGGNSLQEAVVYINPDFTTADDNQVTGAPALLSQSLAASYGPDAIINTGSADITSNIDMVNRVISGTGHVSVSAEFNDAGDVRVDADSRFYLFFNVVGSPQPIQISGNFTLTGNEFTPQPIFFWISDDTFTTFYYNPIMPDPNGSFSDTTDMTLAVGNYALIVDMLNQASADSGNVGPNTSTGSYSFEFLIPEPASGLLLLVGAIPLLRRRR